MAELKPKKFLGQHFLKDLDIARQIVGTLDEFPQTSTIEVGPGMGVLTQYLLEKEADLTVVELDRDSIPYLNEHFSALSGRIVEGDFLKINLLDIYPEKFNVIGNYPYNISSQIFFKVLNYRDHVLCCSGMLQKEVAARIAAPPGSRTYGILSVLIQAWYDVEYLFTVPPTVFNPPPKVDSAVIKMVRNTRTSMNCNEKLFKNVVKTSFNQRRKTLRNSMKPLLGKDCEAYSNILFNKRPEQLSVTEFEELTNITEKFMPQQNINLAESN